MTVELYRSSGMSISSRHSSFIVSHWQQHTSTPVVWCKSTNLPLLASFVRARLDSKLDIQVACNMSLTSLDCPTVSYAYLTNNCRMNNKWGMCQNRNGSAPDRQGFLEESLTFFGDTSSAAKGKSWRHYVFENPSTPFQKQPSGWK